MNSARPIIAVNHGVLSVGGGHGQLEAQQISCSQCHTYDAIEVGLLVLNIAIYHFHLVVC